MQHLATILGASLQRAPWGWALTATVLITVVKLWPAITVASTRAWKARNDAKQLQEASAVSRLAALESKIDQYQDKVIKLERQSNTALMAYRLIAGELARLDPQNPILRQAQQLLGMATESKIKTGNAGLDEFLTTLDGVPGVGENE